MTEHTFEISCPSREHLDTLILHYEQYREVREEISRKVLGHQVDEPGWLLFDEVLIHEYDRMIKLLKVLEERAG